MIAHCLQDWMTLSGNAVSTPYRQSEDQWLELDGFRDCSVWVQSSVPRIADQFNLNLETSPTLDEALFQTVVQIQLGNGKQTIVRVARSRDASVQLARYLRWSVVPTGSTGWSLTFRVFVCLNPTTATFSIRRGNETFTNPTLTISPSP